MTVLRPGTHKSRESAYTAFEMAESHAELSNELCHELLLSQNDDGGWGYARGKASRLEPTAWALLAISTTKAETAAARFHIAIDRLKRWQSLEGLFLDVPDAPNLAFNGLVGTVLQHARPEDPRAADSMLAGLIPALLRVRGVRGSTQSFQRQNNALQGWPWNDGTFTWIEPTAWCLLALKRSALASTAEVSVRIAEAEDVLRDRACPDGGWNYGNSNMLGQQLQPFVPTTAMVLLALHGRQRGPVIGKGLERLQARWRREISGTALALTLLAFRSYDLPGDDVLASLDGAFRRTGFLGNLAVTAMAAYASKLDHARGFVL